MGDRRLMSDRTPARNFPASLKQAATPRHHTHFIELS